MTVRLRVLLLVTVLAAAACTAAADRSASPAAAGSDPDAPWRTTLLRDTRTGETFAVNDLRGKLVVIEPMAIWCSNCLTQQLAAASALARLADPNIVYVSLDIDPNERDEDLAKYAKRSGFEWRFVVADVDVARSLADEFGPQVLSPPSTPLIVIGPNGDVVDQHFGIRNASELVELFDQHRS